MPSPDLTDAERIEGLLRGIPPETAREAQLAGLIRQLRAGALDAPDALRERVRAHDVPPRRSWGWKPALVLVPLVVAGLAAGVVVGRDGGAPSARQSAEVGVAAGGGGGKPAWGTATTPNALDFALQSRTRRAARALAPATAGGGRAQEWDVAMELRVRDNDRLAEASQEAIRTTRALGGYVVSSSIGTHGDGGEARLALRVPSGRIQDAIERFGALGTITAQNVDVQDRQGQLDALARRIDNLRVSIAEVNVKLANSGLSSVERLRLELRRTRLQGLLDQARGTRRGVGEQVALADVSLALRTGHAAATAPNDGRIEGAARTGLHVLAVAGAVTVFLLIVLAPLAAVALALWLVFRARRRRTEESLLDRPRPA